MIIFQQSLFSLDCFSKTALKVEYFIRTPAIYLLHILKLAVNDGILLPFA